MRLVLLILALAGCATTSTARWEDIRRINSKEAAFRKLGPPIRQEATSEGTFYYWGESSECEVKIHALPDGTVDRADLNTVDGCRIKLFN